MDRYRYEEYNSLLICSLIASSSFLPSVAISLPSPPVSLCGQYITLSSLRQRLYLWRHVSRRSRARITSATSVTRPTPGQRGVEALTTNVDQIDGHWLRYFLP